MLSTDVQMQDSNKEYLKKKTTTEKNSEKQSFL